MRAPALVGALAAASLAGTTAAAAAPCAPVPVWRDGHPDGTVCRDAAAAAGLVVIDLGDDWVPPVLAAGADGTGPAYRATYLALAQERWADAALDAELAPSDRYLELYGIAPTPTVVRARLADDARHRCHAAIDDAPLRDAPAAIAAASTDDVARWLAGARDLRAALERDRRDRGLADVAALAAVDAYYGRALGRLRELDRALAAIRVVQAHLACDGLRGDGPGPTRDAVRAFQRGAMLLPVGVLDAATREALATPSRQRDFATALRVLRERVVAATGLVEDGTAGDGEARVLGLALDGESTWRTRGHAPLDGAAPDLVSPATEAAARALGWLDATATRAFLEAHHAALVAVPLPPPPAYHGAAMELSVEIDRGDVWQDRAPRHRDPERRPVLVLYANAGGGRRVALVRWPTTIGGWQDTQRADGDVGPRWTESPVGARQWRDLVVGPVWLPPATTPDRERRAVQLGPSYRAALGVVAFPHVAAAAGDGRRDGRRVEADEGILTHATGDLASLATGTSHGCHRLLGRDAIRLADFVLAHHGHARRGDVASRGYRIELVPPIPVAVLPGRVHRD